MSSNISAFSSDIQFRPENFYSLPGEEVKLSEIIQQSLQKFHKEVKSKKLIFRCEPLPAIPGDKLQIYKLLDGLVAAIITNPPIGNKLFLYVNCEKEKTDGMELTLTNGYKKYVIEFHTNIHTDQFWKIKNEGIMHECISIAQSCQGNLHVNDISKTGCLFSLSLPGKF